MYSTIYSYILVKLCFGGFQLATCVGVVYAVPVGTAAPHSAPFAPTHDAKPTVQGVYMLLNDVPRAPCLRWDSKCMITTAA